MTWKRSLNVGHAYVFTPRDREDLKRCGVFGMLIRLRGSYLGSLGGEKDVERHVALSECRSGIWIVSR